MHICGISYSIHLIYPRKFLQKSSVVRNVIAFQCLASYVHRNIMVRTTLLLPISPSLSLCVNMVMLFSWMLQSAVHLHKLDAVQKGVRLCIFQSLLSRCKACAIGLLCQLLDFHCRQPLQVFCPTLISVTHAHRCRLQYICH